jgi:hypothetical protein
LLAKVLEAAEAALPLVVSGFFAMAICVLPSLTGQLICAS